MVHSATTRRPANSDRRDSNSSRETTTAPDDAGSWTVDTARSFSSRTSTTTMRGGGAAASAAASAQPLALAAAEAKAQSSSGVISGTSGISAVTVRAYSASSAARRPWLVDGICARRLVRRGTVLRRQRADRGARSANDIDRSRRLVCSRPARFDTMPQFQRVRSLSRIINLTE